ncbi:MAG: 23S rRNA (cytidine1920-2'-O)/16S rRNA (cytidine1409-2'-O)-methyltransferase [bacterium]|jgi:23S rRNA (cytidine1920-2'-O)/16S rRNA (cytidine1409-2'-O)-methyltransferase
MAKKVRIDKLLFEKGLAPSRERAQAYLLAGKVFVNDRQVDKPGTLILPDSDIRVKGEDHPYVSRGGLKLEHALKEFHIPVKHSIAMDVGASTGGFTDCLLQNGSNFVFAVDVGHSQLSWKLISDSRVKNLEKTNFRYLKLEQIGTFVDLIVIDASFISLNKILKNTPQFLTKGGHLVALIKPQFEAGKDALQKGGVVRDQNLHQQIIQSVKDEALTLNFQVCATCDSPIQGKKKKNQEFFIHLMKND